MLFKKRCKDNWFFVNNQFFAPLISLKSERIKLLTQSLITKEASRSELLDESEDLQFVLQVLKQTQIQVPALFQL